MDAIGREHTEMLMSIGDEFAALIIIGGFLLYFITRLSGHRPNFILFFIIFLFPTSVLYVNVGFHLFYHRMLLILFFVWFAISKLFKLHDIKLLLNETSISGFYFLLTCLPGLLVCIDYNAFWRWWVAILVGILLYIVIFDQIKSIKDLEAIIFSCIVSGFVWAGVGLVLFFTGNQTLETDDIRQIYRLSALSKDANFFASILIAWIQLAFFWFIRKDEKNKIVVFVALISMIAAFIFTYSRGGLLALFVVAIINGLYFTILKIKFAQIVNFKKVKSFAILMGVIGIIGIAAVGSLRDRIISIKGDEKLGAGRGYIWIEAIDVIKRNPLGVGLNNYQEYTIKHKIRYKTAGSSVHNVFLHVTAETGIPGLFAYLFFLGTILFKVRHAGNFKNKELYHWFMGSFAAIIGILTCSMFISNIYRENLFVAVAIFLAIFSLHRKSIVGESI